jgi:hypothetical protein
LEPPARNETSASGEAAAARPFCDEATAAFRSLADAFAGAGTQDPAALPPLLAQTVDALGEVEPPEEIAGDSQTVRDAFVFLRERVPALDLADPGAGDQVEAALLGLREDVGAAFERITAYTQQYCPELAAPPYLSAGREAS